MGNATKGETTLTVDGETFTLAYTMNALCKMEDRFGDLSKLEETLKSPKIADIRAILFFGLQKHHASDFADEEAVGEKVPFQEATDAVSLAIAAAFPPPAGGTAKAAGKRRPRTGTS